MSAQDGDGMDDRLRFAAAIVVLLLIAVLVLSDVFGRLFVDPSFSISDLMLGILIGALLLLAGIDVSRRIPRWPPLNGRKRDEDEDEEDDD